MEKKIVVQKNKVIEFSDERSKKLVENAIKKNEKFFGNLVCDFSVTFLKTRKEYDKLVNYFYDRILERNKVEILACLQLVIEAGLIDDILIREKTYGFYANMSNGRLIQYVKDKKDDKKIVRQFLENAVMNIPAVFAVILMKDAITAGLKPYFAKSENLDLCKAVTKKYGLYLGIE